MAGSNKYSQRRRRVGRSAVATLIVAVCSLTSRVPAAHAQSAYSLSYSARLSSSNGAPLTDPLNVKAAFWDASSGGQQLGQTLSFDQVPLNNGVLTLDLALTNSQVNEVFGDGSHAVYIEITAGDKTYPRQKYSFVPLALRIPFDEKTLKFNDSGKLSLAVGAKPNSNSFLTQDSSGALTWGSPTATQLSIVDQDIASSAAISQTKISGLSAALAAKEGAITAGTTSQYFRGDKTWHALTTASVTEAGTNLYYTDARARSALVGSGPINYSVVSGTIGISQASISSPGYLSSSDWNTFNTKQNALGYSPLNKAGDTMSGSLDMNSSDIKNTGNVTMAGSKTFLLSNNTIDPSGLSMADKGRTWFNSATNEVKYWDGTSARALGVAGSGLANLNGVTTTTQTFATPGITGIAPGWSSSGSAHTLNIPLASAAGVTAGLLSNSDYIAFVNKVGAVAGTTGISVTNGSGTATVTLTNTAVTPGTYARANITVDAQGRITAAQSAPAIVDTDISSTAAIAQSKIAGLSTSFAGKEDAVTAGTSSQYYRGDKTWQSLNSTAVSEGSNLYYTDARARSALAASGPITYSIVSGTIGMIQSSGSTNGYLSSSDWNTFNTKQNALGYSPLNKAGDTMSGSLDMNSSDLRNAGNVSMAASKTLLLSNNATDPNGLTAADKGKTWFNSATNEVKYWDGSSAKALGVAGSGIANLNGVTAATQTFATPGTTGTAPGWSSSGSAHTLNIPLASASGVTAGLVSNSDYTSFTNKVSSVTAGTGLTGGGSSGAVTLNADVGTTANKIVQLDANAKIPAVDGSALTNLNPSNLSTAVSVAKGGTGLTSGTSGGLPYFNATSTMASSSTLNANGVVLGGGSGAAPTSTSAGAANSVLRVPAAGGAPAFGAIDLAQSAAVGGVLGLGNGGLGASLSATGGTGQYLKQTATGATVTVGSIAAADLPSMVGDSGSGGTKGAVPAPAIGDAAAGKYLKADGTWANPSSSINWAAPGAIGATTPSTGVFTTLTTSGNVGIGTTAPSNPLQVYNATSASIAVKGQGGTHGLYLGADANHPWLGSSTNSDLRLITNSTEKVRVTSAGNVGIATTTPAALLQVGSLTETTPATNTGTIKVTGATQTSLESVGGIELPVATNGYGIKVQALSDTGSSFAIARRNASATWTESLRINPNGYVGIGTTAPASALDVNGTITLSNAMGIAWRNAGGTANQVLRADLNNNIYAGDIFGNFNGLFSLRTSGADRLTITNGGNVGIGTTMPAAILDVNGTIRATSISLSSNTSALGQSATASGSGAAAFGYGASAASVNSVAIGYMASAPASGGYQVATGYASLASGNEAVAIGHAATASSGFSVAVGENSTASGNQTTAIGPQASATGNLATAIGSQSTASGNYAIAIGQGSTASAANSFVAGSAAYPITSVYFGSGIGSSTPSAYSLNGSGASGTDLTGGSLTLAAGNGTGTGGSGSLMFQTAPTATTGATPNTLTTRMAITSGGNVGIGTENPIYPLHVNGQIGSAGKVYSYGFAATSLGSGGSPVFSFQSDSGSGMFLASPGNLGFATNWSEKVRINTAGNVGINTTAPTEKLHIASVKDSTTSPYSTGLTVQDTTSMAAGVGGGIEFMGNFTGTTPTEGATIHALKSNGTAGDYGFDLAFNTRVNGGGNTEKMRITTSGNVGIGTTAPQSKFDVYANGTGLSLEPGNGTTFFGTLGFNREASNGNIISAGHNAYQFTNFDNRFQLEVYNGGGTAVTYSALAVNSAGNVGIGTTNPPDMLVVNNNQNAWTGIDVLNANSGTSAASSVTVGSALTGGQYGYLAYFGSGYTPNGFQQPATTVLVGGNTGGLLLDAYSGPLTLYTGTTERMRINGSGNVGIGTTAPVAGLDVIANLFHIGQASGTVATQGLYEGWNWQDSGLGRANFVNHHGLGTGGFTFDDTYGSGTTVTRLMTITGSGNVGIGTTAPSQALDVNGNINLSGYIVQEAWIAPTLQNNWVLNGGGYEPVGYYKNKNGEIHIKGLVKNGTSGTVVFTLPVGYRPNYNRILPTLSASGGTVLACILYINSDGTVAAGGGCGTTWLTLEAVFRP